MIGWPLVPFGIIVPVVNGLVGRGQEESIMECAAIAVDLAKHVFKGGGV